MKIRTSLLAICLGLLAAIGGSAWASSVSLANNQYHPFRLAVDQPTRSIEFSVSGTQLIIDVATPLDQAMPAVTLNGPGGLSFGPSQFTTVTLDEDTVPPLGAAVFQPGNHTQLALEAPAQGRWTLHLELPAGEAEVFGDAAILQAGGPSIGAFTSRPQYASSQTAVVGAALFDGSEPVTGASVEARLLLDLEAPPLVIDLYDSGIGPDAEAGDGLYTGAVGGLVPGHYVVEVVAEVAGATLTGATEFSVIEPLALFAGPVTDQAVDLNGNGLFDELHLSVDIEVTEPGSYALLGRMVANGAEITAGNRMELAGGLQQGTLSFAAEALREHLAQDGPYRITDIVLIKPEYGLQAQDLVLDRLSEVGDTDAYSLNAFSRPPIIVHSGIVDQATDRNADSYFDELSILFRVSLLHAGSYTWSGVLQSEDGTTISVASGRAFLGASTHSLELWFPGTDIGESGLDGPYYLRDVVVYSQTGLAAVNPMVGMTMAYSASLFTGSEVSFARLLHKVQELILTGPGGVPRTEGIRTSLLAKLGNAQRLGEEGRAVPAANLLGAFAHEVAAQAGTHIAQNDAAELIDLAQRLAANL